MKIRKEKNDMKLIMYNIFSHKTGVKLYCLPYLDLVGKDLTNMNLTNADLKGKNLRGSNFSGSNLTHADLSNCDLRDCNFTGCHVIGCKIEGSNLIGAIGFGRASNTMQKKRRFCLDDLRKFNPLNKMMSNDIYEKVKALWPIK